MKEKDIQVLFGNKNTVKGVFELKLCKGKSIRWDAVKEHQIGSLLKAKHETIYHKISDSPFTQKFTLKKPFDCFNIQADAYVVACFYIPRKQKKCYYIDIDKYIESSEKSSKKSYREDEAALMASHIIELS